MGYIGILPKAIFYLLKGDYNLIPDPQAPKDVTKPKWETTLKKYTRSPRGSSDDIAAKSGDPS